LWLVVLDAIPATKRLDAASMPCRHRVQSQFKSSGKAIFSCRCRLNEQHSQAHSLINATIYVLRGKLCALSVHGLAVTVTLKGPGRAKGRPSKRVKVTLQSQGNDVSADLGVELSSTPTIECHGQDIEIILEGPKSLHQLTKRQNKNDGRGLRGGESNGFLNGLMSQG
jgi:hypothetical protein